MATRIIFTTLFLFINLLEISSQRELVSGLYFSSHEVIQDKRTSLNLTPNDLLKLPEGFSLEFDANFREGDGYYGYIFRIVGDGDINIDMVSNLASTTSNFWLVAKDQILFSYKWSDIPNGNFKKWLKIKVEIDVKKSKLTVSFNGMKKEASIADIGNLKEFEISFGASKNSTFSSTDVCPMSLKNIRIYNEKQQLYRHWELSRHCKDDHIYDEITNAKADVYNPNWIIDKHVKWRLLKKINIDKLNGIATDEENGRLFFVNNNNIFVLSGDSWKIDTIPFSEGSPYHDTLTKQIVYNKYTNELWSYNFSENAISKFDFNTSTWSIKEATLTEPNFAHNNKFISPFDSSLVAAFGYGHYNYKSIINHYDRNSNRWEQINRNNQIEPRYLSSMGFISARKMLVFGGYGSKTGRQELSPGFYYDLHVFDLQDFSFKKLWNLPSPVSPFVPSEELIYDEKSNSFYTLVYNSLHYETSLRLVKFGVENPEYQFYDDSIPYNFIDIESWTSLFLNNKSSELIAVTAHNSDISVYAMAYPPLMPTEVYQNIKQNKGVLFNLFWIFVLLIPTLFIYFAWRKRNLKSAPPTLLDSDYVGIEPIFIPEKKTISSIIFLNGFQIFNSKGIEITSEFSPTMKYLFLFIFINTMRNGKGITSSKIDEILWSDKSGKSARNNRNVTISKLRTILEKVGDIEVLNDNLLWKISIKDNVYCDYIEILNMLKRAQSSTLPENDILNLVGLLSRGMLLPNIQTSWCDSFKSAFADEVIDYFTALIKTKNLENNFSLRYHLANCLLTYDPLNDIAIAIKCQVLNMIGKRSTAKHTYDSFCTHYKELLGENFSVPFKDIIIPLYDNNKNNLYD